MSPVPLAFAVRPMRMADIPAVMAIERASFLSPWPASAYRHEIRRNRDSYFFVVHERRHGEARPRWQRWVQVAAGAEVTAPALGYAGFRLRGDEAHIANIAVHPEWRGRGLGELLLLTMLEKAIELGASSATLEVRPSNRVAQRLYHKYGFMRVAERSRYYRDGEDAWLLALKPLNEACRARLAAFRRVLEVRLHAPAGHVGQNERVGL